MFVDDDDFVVFHHVIAIALENHVGLQRRLHVMVGFRSSPRRTWPLLQPSSFSTFKRNAFFRVSPTALCFSSRRCLIARGSPFLPARPLSHFDHFTAGPETG